jgi:hypothetical protein
VARVVVIGLMAGVMGLGAATLQAGESSHAPSPPFSYDEQGRVIPAAFERGESPVVFASVRFYDTEANAGWHYIGPEVTGRLGLENGSIYHH